MRIALAIGLVSAGCILFGFGNGCGSDDDNTAPSDDAGANGDGAVPTSAGGRACGAPNAACTNNTECCANSCVNGKCSGTNCTADNAACKSDAECCGGKCAGTCTPLNTSCKTSGNPCAADGDCCSKSCVNGLCSSTTSFCIQNTDACANDADCCGGLCTKASGATLGTCGLVSVAGATGCTPAGQICDGPTTGGSLPTCGGSCCSKSCRPYAPTGKFICQPPSGCHPTGELCTQDSDCCGAKGSAGSTDTSGGMKSTDVHCEKPSGGGTIGRCDNGNACSPAGSICRLATNSCDATDRCCAGTVQTHPLNCKQDSLGIPRCTAEGDYDCASKGPPAPGTACASSADCCGNPCIPNPSGSPPFVCGSACVPVSGACTTTADCCAGSPCNIPQGSTKGTCGPTAVGSTTPPDSGTTTPPPPPGTTNCAQYGQRCTSAGDCCDQVPCTSGFCIFPGPN